MWSTSDDSMGPAGGYRYACVCMRVREGMDWCVLTCARVASCWYEEARQGWSFFFLGLVVLTVVYNMIVYAFVTKRYYQMLKLSGIYSTEHGAFVHMTCCILR